MLDAIGHERRKLVDEFLRLSEGSFFTVYKALEAALDDAALALQAHRLITLRLVFWDARRELDGETYHGLMRFRAVTEPIV